MSIDKVSNSGLPPVKPIKTANPSTAPTPSAAAAALQEATESKATTQTEALKGDPVAIRKLQREQVLKQEQTSPPKASESGKGEQLDKEA